MKNYLKNLFRKKNNYLFLIFFSGAVVRLYNFSDRITFWSEQARSLIVSAEYLQKFSLLGQEYFRQDPSGHIIFSGALFNYSLIPLIIASNWDPIKITFYFAILNLFTGLLVFNVAKKIWDEKVAIFSLLLFIFNDTMIYHSLFIWNYNYLPLVGILIIYTIWKQSQVRDIKNIFLIGLLCGIGVSLQILFAIFILPVSAFILWKSNAKLKYLIVFIFALIVGNLPMVIFDLRHSFYEAKTILGYLTGLFIGGESHEFAYYYLLPLWPVIAISTGIILAKVNKYIAYAVIVIYIGLNVFSEKVQYYGPTGMPHKVTVSELKDVAMLIKDDNEGDFNVTSLMDFDKRAYALRYILKYNFGEDPLSVTEYSNLNCLYVLAVNGYNFEKSNIWEINASKYNSVTKLATIGEDLSLYRLNK